MIIATADAFGTRIFIGCADLAVEFAAWLQMNGWQVRIEADVDPRSQPRLKEEEEVAAVLVSEFDKWKGAQG